MEGERIKVRDGAETTLHTNHLWVCRLSYVSSEIFIEHYDLAL